MRKQELTEERIVERDNLSETFADLFCSARRLQAGTCSSRSASPASITAAKRRSEVGFLWLGSCSLTKVTNELAAAFATAMEARETVTGDDNRVAITFEHSTH